MVCHLVHHENRLNCDKGHHLTLSDVEANTIISSDVHLYDGLLNPRPPFSSPCSAPTEVIALENTLNGTIIPQEEVVAISDFAHSNNIKMHLDGARLWHVAAETGVSLKELSDPFDSVSVCFSKGLGTRLRILHLLDFRLTFLRKGAPIGSCLVGSKELIKKARWFRKLFGGGMRQTGVLAGCAAYALSHNFPLLPRVHELTRKLETGLEKIGAEITSRAETCMASVFFWL